ncbi:MAG: hypothetical protein ACFCU1_04875 [Sumerlaeia bacterium]
MSRMPKPFQPTPTPTPPEHGSDSVWEKRKKPVVINGTRGDSIPAEVEQRLRAQLETFRHDLSETPDRVGYSTPKYKSSRSLTLERVIHDGFFVLLGIVSVCAFLWFTFA